MHFPADGAFRAEEKVLGDLLGQRRAALHHGVGPGVLDDRAHRADDVDPEMLEEAGVFRGKHRLDQGGRHFFKRNGVVLPDAALADDLAIGIGKGDGELAVLVPDITGARRKAAGQRPGGRRQSPFRRS